jgi:hypothetical protein
MAHYVTCIHCKEKFNRDKEEFIQVSERRYAHKKCAEAADAEKDQELKDLEALEEYIMKVLDEEYITARVRKQIKDFKKEYNYTYSGMLKSLIWWYDIKGNSAEKANGGIGILPFIYNDAYNYYLNLFLANQQNINKDVKSYTSKVREITIKSPVVEFSKKLFNLDDEVEDEQTE